MQKDAPNLLKRFPKCVYFGGAVEPIGILQDGEHMWSSECSAERGRGQEQLWVFGTPSDKWNPSHVLTYKKGKQLRVMAWAAFWGHGKRTPLYILERDWEAKNHGYYAQFYNEILEDNLPYHYTDDLIFIQDNAPIHTAHTVRDWLRENGIRVTDRVTDWAPYSSDLNPIEHAWKALKEMVNKMYPDALPDSLFESLVCSMEKRIQACIEADGWHTKY